MYPAFGQTSDAPASGLMALVPGALLLGAFSGIGYYGGSVLGKRVTHSAKRAKKWAMAGAIGVPAGVLVWTTIAVTQFLDAFGRSKGA